MTIITGNEVIEMETNLQIKMVGIDHNKASIEYRELFSFTKAGAVDAMRHLRERYPIEGCVLLSTCNRTELWISAESDLSPYQMLCSLRGTNAGQYRDLFIEREGEKAAMHLLELSCGLDSKIFGEDQIISQVREAIVLAQKHHCTDMVLEKVFQTAIGAAKKVKSQVQLAEADGSTALQVVSLLKEKLGDIRGITCFMIGNGKMGQLICNTLLTHGATVKMTLRKTMHGIHSTESAIPEGCIMIPYEDRIRELASSNVVISATRSPHYTLKKNEVEGYLNKEPSIWIDLAVPRDIEPEVGSLEGITLFDIDHLAKEESRAKNDNSREAAMKILQEYLDELKQWFAFRERVPEIQDIVRLSVEDVSKRLDHPMETIELPEDEKKQIQIEIERAVEKSIGKLLFGLKDTLRHSLWKECLDAVYDAANKDTLKS
ncbi:MAG TPA: glutamyl-tRNA reductase [Anaerovoracaceae bacterium]|nr:glutamyl-tRNA reductase [Anaerovoracaceae bacterium]